MYFLDDDIYFDENDFEIMGIDEFTAYEYIWDLSKLNLINMHDDKFFIDKNLIIEFIEDHYLSQYTDEHPIIKRDNNSVDTQGTKIDKVDNESAILKIYNDSEESHVTKNYDDYEVYDPSKIKIKNNPNYRRDIMNLVENIEFIEESSKIPFPQSDDLNRFIFIGRTLLKKDLSKEEIRQSNQIGNRIVNMYVSTGFYFHVFERYKRENKVYYKLSDKGRYIFELDDYQLNINICKCILEHEILHRIFMDCKSNNSISKNNIVGIMLQYDLNLNSMVTIKRRAGCISSWMHWIFDLIKDGNTKQTKLF